VFCGSATAQDGDLTQFRLSNGLKVIVKEDHSRKLAAIQLWVMVGSAYEEDPERGISHVIEHMAFKGTKTRGVGQIAREVEQIGGEINAYTSWDETVFHIVLPSHALSQGLDIVTDAVFRASLDQEEFEKEKRVVLEEILEEADQPEQVAFNLVFKTAYVRSPYRFPIIGSKESVANLSRKDILDFYAKWYVPENMFLLVVGDVDPDMVRKEVERLTSDVKSTCFVRPSLPQEPVQTEIRTALVRDPNAIETRLDLAFHIPSMKGNDINALDLAADILAGREDSRLVRLLKREKNIVNSIFAASFTPKEPGLFSISVTLPSGNLEAATRGVLEELSRLQEAPPTAQELQDARNHIESQHVYGRETVQGTAKLMGAFQNQLDDANYEDKYLELNSAVTSEQISAAVRKYLLPPNLTITVLLPRNEAKEFEIRQLEAVAASFQSARKVSPRAAAEPVYRELSNGLKVALVPDNSNPVISFRIACLGGKRFETPDTQGIMNFIARMVDKGTGTMTELDIARKVNEMGGSLSGFSGNDSFGLSASFFSRHWNRGLELLAQLYMDPAFPEKNLERERDLILNDIKTEPDAPESYALNVLNKATFPEFPYGYNKLGTLATVSGFTGQDLKLTFRRFAIPSNTVIAVVGKMDTQEVLAEIERIFGALPAGSKEIPEILEEKPMQTFNEMVIDVPRAKAHLALGFRTVTHYDPDRFALDVLNHILAGQGGRLFLQLRDKESLAYSVTSFFRPGMSPGIFGLYMACDAPKVDRAFAGLVEQIKLIRETRVSDSELNKGINNLVGNYVISLQSSADRAEDMGLNTLYGLGHDYSRVYLQKVREVTGEDVQRVARKYLDLDRCGIVKVLPAHEKTGRGAR
jgi:zinc protease